MSGSKDRRRKGWKIKDCSSARARAKEPRQARISLRRCDATGARCNAIAPIPRCHGHPAHAHLAYDRRARLLARSVRLEQCQWRVSVSDIKSHSLSFNRARFTVSGALSRLTQMTLSLIARSSKPNRELDYRKLWPYLYVRIEYRCTTSNTTDNRIAIDAIWVR